jgi:tetratricopeptide (TPR) repeat protein
MQSQDETYAPLQDYPDRSVWTTWTISFYEIRRKNQNAANLLSLWAFLDNKDLWYGLLSAACRLSSVAATMLSEWIGEIASKELEFTKAIQLLPHYSMIEDVENLESYATHPVVHRWAYSFQGEDSRMRLAQLAVVIVEFAVPNRDTREYWTVQRRLLPHAQRCSRWILETKVGKSRSHYETNISPDEIDEEKSILDAIHGLGCLYYMDQGKLADAEKMYERALQGKEEVFGPNHPSTLATINNLGLLYTDLGKLPEAERLLERALQGCDALGYQHESTISTVGNLGLFYGDQGNLAEAEKMFDRALKGYEEALGPKHTSTLNTMNNLGLLYINQGNLAEAERLLERALQGFEEALGPTHTFTLDTIKNLGILYEKKGRMIEAEKMHERWLQVHATGPSDIVRTPGSGPAEDTRRSKFSVRRFIRKFR